MSENVDSHGGEVSPEVYRRRRIVALLVLVLVLLLGIGLVSWLVGRGGDSEPANTAASTSASAEAFSDFSQRATESASPSPSDDESADASATPDESESAEPTESASEEPTEPAEPTESAEPTEEATPNPTETPAVAAACTPADLQVSLTADRTSYAAGQNPALAVTYTNASDNPCLVTGGVANVDVNITSGPAQVFNYAQCHAAPAEDAQVEAGATNTTSLSWDRSLNVLGCDTNAKIQPGHYWATASVNGVNSQPVRIVVTG